MSKPKILIASYPNIFLENLIELLGDRFEIIASGASDKAYLDNSEINYKSVKEMISPIRWKFYKLLGRFILSIEKLYYRIELRNSNKVNTTLKKPTISTAITNSLMLGRIAKEIKPDIVIGLNLFAFGLAVSNLKSVSVCYIFGSDYFTYPAQSSIRQKFVKRILNRLNYTLSGSKDLCSEIKKLYNTPYILMPLTFSASMQEKLDFFEKNQDDVNTSSELKKIFFCRRFIKSHGSEIIGEAVIQMAKEEEGIEIILLSGARQNEKLDELEEKLRSSGVLHKVRIYKGSISLDRYIQLAYESDIFVSMMQFADMKSQSNRICGYCKTIPVLLEWPAYREMKAGGFKYITIENNNVKGLLKAINVALCSNPKEYLSNRNYLSGNNGNDLIEFRRSFAHLAS